MTSAERHEARYQRRVAERAARRQRRQVSFEQTFSFDNMYEAYRLCCNGVRWKASVQSYSANALSNVRNKQREILEGREKTMGFVEFDINDRGKRRHIMSCHISDRVAQRCFCDHALLPIIRPSLIHDNGSSLKGKGNDFALDRLDAHLHRHFRRHGQDGYILMADFKSFFGNLPHQTAKTLLAKHIQDQRLYNKACDCLAWYGDSGVGLGAMTSQVIAVCTPNPLDHFCKEALRIKEFGRYMDDFYAIDISKDRLRHCLSEIRKKCAELGLKLNEAKTRIMKISHGFTFLKIRYSLTETGAVIRRPYRKAITRMRRKLHIFRDWVTRRRMTFQEAMASFASWLGCIRRSRCYFAIQRMKALFRSLFKEEIAECTTLSKALT